MGRKEKAVDPDSLAHPASVFDDKNNVIPWDNLSREEKMLAMISLGLIRPRQNQKSAGGEGNSGARKGADRRKSRGRRW